MVSSSSSSSPSSSPPPPMLCSEYEYRVGWDIQRLCAEYQHQSSTLTTTAYNIEAVLQPLLGRVMFSLSPRWGREEAALLTAILEEYKNRLRNDTSFGPTSRAYKINYVLRPLLMEKLVQERPFFGAAAVVVGRRDAGGGGGGGGRRDDDDDDSPQTPPPPRPPPPPPLHIVLMTVGSRGDVQPFIALAKGLERDGHRCRVATHECFRKWIAEDHKLDFFPLAGDPKELMAMMVENDNMFSWSFIKEALSTKRGKLHVLPSNHPPPTPP